MENLKIEGKHIQEWKNECSIIDELISTREVFWSNPKYEEFQKGIKKALLNEQNLIFYIS